ncbi:unnamed protein product [Adineta steineri]|uniref:PARP catalytic domain-containing protein n=1 Tax=Adineta steineri TaxID=433720 RepID=A0A814QCX5_9BILA|nr:unnamed protein product [Adineta steineri]CAF3693670.1 unnamed protein product [Adineta steineri]
MCCCHCSCLYRNLPFFHGLTGFLEMVLGVVRIILFFSPLPSGVHKKYTSKYTAAFIIDWISSIVATLVGVFTALIILLIFFRTCVICCRLQSKNPSNSTTSGIIRGLLGSKSVRRFLIIDCNCTCYKARPKRRFQVRFILLFIFFVLRITAIGLYASAPVGDNDGGLIAIVCAISLVFIFNTLCLDFYRYWVWWHYTPKLDTRCHITSNKHERYLPYHMIGSFRDPRTLGDRPYTEKPCHKRTLDHIAVFHSYDYQPQDRWRDIPKPPPNTEPKKSIIPCIKPKLIDNQPHYIGFHTTDPMAAISIAHSQFQPGRPGWIGQGIYFARSVAGTIGKAKSEGGAFIIAEIRMGRVYEVERQVITKGHARFDAQIYEYAHRGKWKDDYDTCYMLQNPESTDEFAIKDASQIVKWVTVIEQDFDPKVERYGLLTEFDSTKCGCI